MWIEETEPATYAGNGAIWPRIVRKDRGKRRE